MVDTGLARNNKMLQRPATGIRGVQCAMFLGRLLTGQHAISRGGAGLYAGRIYYDATSGSAVDSEIGLETFSTGLPTLYQTMRHPQ